MDGMDGIGNGATFGAAVVKETLDKMNTGNDGGLNAEYRFQNQVLGAAAGLGAGAAGELAAPMDRQTFGAAVVSETLDLMNTDSMGNMDSSYDFQKQVLGAIGASGSIVDKKS